MKNLYRKTWGSLSHTTKILLSLTLFYFVCKTLDRS